MRRWNQRSSTIATPQKSTISEDIASPETQMKRAYGQSARSARPVDALALNVPEGMLEIIEAEGMQQLMVLPGSKGTPVAACTLLLEPKFLRGASHVAHLTEQLVRGGRMRAELLRQLIEIARAHGAYKAILDAPPSDGPALRACGFSEKGLTMMAELVGGGDSDRDNDADNGVGIGIGIGAGSSLSLASPRPLGDRYALRPLNASDGGDRYVSLLRQLSQAPPLPDSTFLSQLERVRAAKGLHQIFVVEELPPVKTAEALPQLVGCCSVVLERVPVPGAGGKLLNVDVSSEEGGGRASRSSLVARIEDVVVDQSTRGTGLGKAMILELLAISRERGAVHATLNCDEANEGFYAKCGFHRPPRGEMCWGLYMGVK